MVGESFFDRFGGGLASDLAGSLTANSVEHCEQTHLGDREKAILIHRALRI